MPSLQSLRVLQRWDTFWKSLFSEKLNILKNPGNPIFGQIFCHQKAKIKGWNTEVNMGQVTYQKWVNVRY